MPNRRLLCCWHVDNNWRRKLAEVVSVKVLQAEIYKVLRCLLIETDEKTFAVLMKAVLEHFDENKEIEASFAYFKRHYVPRAEMWAYASRKWAGVNTNMHIERMHRTIKHSYLQGKKVKRLDKCIHSLMQFLRDKIFYHIIALEKGKVSSKMSALRSRHNLACL